jgi:hypothetical protein
MTGARGAQNGGKAGDVSSEDEKRGGGPGGPFFFFLGFFIILGYAALTGQCGPID